VAVGLLQLADEAVDAVVKLRTHERGPAAVAKRCMQQHHPIVSCRWA
jgi:hypothetical protein